MDAPKTPEIDEETARVTWTPDPVRPKYGYGPGYIFTPDGTGGGTLEYKSKITGRLMKITKRPHLGG